MPVKFRYCRDRDNRPLITVCEYVPYSTTKVMGIAICSPKDNPNKLVGKRIALQRALHAAYGSVTDSSLPIFRIEALQVLEACEAEYQAKAIRQRQ